MKNYLALTMCMAVLLVGGPTGCRSVEATLPGGTRVKASSFACRLTIGGLSISTNGTATLQNYNLDEVSGIQAIAEGVAKGVAAGIKP